MKTLKFVYAILFIAPLLFGTYSFTTLSNEVEEDFATPELASDCEKALGKIAVRNNMLVFEDNDHFTSTFECLDQAVSDHNDAFDAKYGTKLSEEEYERIEKEISFSEEQPLIDFEKGKSGFSSLRRDLYNKETKWLDAEKLDWDNDPNDHQIISETLRTLINSDCKVIIGGKVHNLCDEVEAVSSLEERVEIKKEDTSPHHRNIIDEKISAGICPNSDCCLFGYESEDFEYNNGSKRFSIYAGVTFFTFGSIATARVRSYKKRNGNWRRHKTRLYVQILGKETYSGTCKFVSNFGKDKGPKNRRSLSTSHWDWGSAIWFKDEEVGGFCTVGSSQLPGNVLINL